MNESNPENRIAAMDRPEGPSEISQPQSGWNPSFPVTRPGGTMETRRCPMSLQDTSCGYVHQTLACLVGFPGHFATIYPPVFDIESGNGRKVVTSENYLALAQGSKQAKRVKNS